MMTNALPLTLSGLLGILLWAATSIASGRAEPWDSDLFWSASYPSAIVLAGAIGFMFPERPWRWAVMLIFSQLAVIAVSAPGLGLLPIGLFMLGILSLPAVALAMLTGRIRRALG